MSKEIAIQAEEISESSTVFAGSAPQSPRIIVESTGESGRVCPNVFECSRKRFHWCLACLLITSIPIVVVIIYVRIVYGGIYIHDPYAD
eukprot:snap_masked-scaffold_39-processed-gene-2.59-mRNA-1 protein AED:1.00 eAED:1.00 QI:0/-1/0/0/-1/1/1/0/88